MAYCDVNDVYLIGLHGGEVFTSTTNPTITQVEAWIDRITRYIDSELYSWGINVPVSQITSPYAYALLTDLCALGTAAEVELLNYRKFDSKAVENSATLSKKQFLKTLNEYCQRPGKLIDADLRNTALMTEGVNGSFVGNTIQDKYDYEHVENLDVDGIKPIFRFDDEDGMESYTDETGY